MKCRRLHQWTVTTAEARDIQQRLCGLFDATWGGGPVKIIAGADVGFPDKATVLAAVVVLSFPELKVLETAVARRPCTFPYVPGLLAFREAPGLLAALERLETEFDLLMCDAQGLAHPRRMGLATHVGILLERPVIGCAKSLLYGKFESVPETKGSYSLLLDERGGTIGAALRTRDGVEPVYVSVGNKIDLETAIGIVLACSIKYRIPEPLRAAHKLSTGRDIPVDATSDDQRLL